MQTEYGAKARSATAIFLHIRPAAEYKIAPRSARLCCASTPGFGRVRNARSLQVWEGGPRL
jgi:hypothetical protein